jgi:hypothetical protein
VSISRKSRDDVRSRALGVLVGYVLTKFSLKNDDIRSGITSFGGQFSPTRLKGLQQGRVILSELEYQRLSHHILSILKKPEYYKEVIRDYAWLRPLLLETRLDENINVGGRNQIPQDLSFFRAFNVDPRGQDKVYQRIGGLWHVIRRSIDPHRAREAKAYYNFSLLNVKPRRYIGSAASSLSTINSDFRTIMNHFSVRSRLGTNQDGRICIFRGRMFETDNVIYFLGDRREFPTPKIFVMAWATPPIPEYSNHADLGIGIMMTVASDNATIVVPILARYIDKTMEEEVTVGPDVRSPERERFEKLSQEYDERISEMRYTIKTFQKEEIEEVFQKYNNRQPIENVLHWLDEEVSRVANRTHLRL